MRTCLTHYVLLLLLMPFTVSAQQKRHQLPVSSLVSSIDSFYGRMPVEKVYVHIDKPYYSNIDTIWLKAYVLNGGLQSSEQSGLLYTELVNDTGKVVLRQAMPVLLGLSWGQLPLGSFTIPEGAYTLRAYTNWMQNMGEAGFFTRQLYISKTDENAWLVKTGSKTTRNNDGINTEMTMQLTGQDGAPVRLRNLQLKLTGNGSTILKDKMQTDIDGRLSFNFNIPQKANAGSLTLVAEDIEKNGSNDKEKLVIPLNLNIAEEPDVQFMPEGGIAVAGLTGKIGFKAIGGDGRGVNISGVLLDSKGREAAAFQSSHQGMGSFVFTPAAGERYTARVTLPGATKTYSFPEIKPSGITLTVNNIPGRDSILVAVQATADIEAKSGNGYSLIAQSGGKVCHASSFSFKAGSNIINGRIAKNRFPTGVARLTLFDADNRPLAERIIFIDHRDGLNIKLTTGEPHPGDSVAVSINVTDKENRPVQGSLSVAVTDDSQLKADSTNAADITAYMLLQSELKGNIEQPGYYFNNPTTETEINLDNLLLTQGWVAYEWKDIFDISTPQFRAEKAIEVTGVVKRLNTPQAGLKVSLLSTYPMLMRDTVTDSNGRFRFSDLPRIDTAAFMIHTKDKKGKVFEAAVEVDEFTPAHVKKLSVPRLTPWYVNSDSTLLNYNRQNITLQKEMEKVKYPDGIKLNEVIIKAKKVVKGSKNLNGPGNADQVLDEEEMIAAGKMSLYDLLLKKIKGFTIKTLFIENPKTLKKEVIRTFFAVNDKQLRFIFDGVDLDFYVQPEDILTETSYLNFVRRAIDQFTAEDIRGIEILYGGNYTGKYSNSYGNTFTEPEGAIPHATPCWRCVPPRYAYSAYIEITTWSGGSMFSKRKKGAYLYRPMPVSWPKTFYNPKYSAKNNTVNGLRSTIYWEPNLLTDTAGKANFTFYPGKKQRACT
ncbi:MAG: hypothetical protein EOP51_20165, partial [Sphingobacteriales bacterium]